MPHRRVFLLGEEKLHLFQRNQSQSLAVPDGNVRACFSDLLKQGLGEPARMSECGGELLLTDGLQEIAYRLRVERLHRVFVERSCEDDRWWLIQRVQVLRGLDAVDTGHSYIQQHDVRGERSGSQHCFFPCDCLTDDVDLVQLSQK